VSAQTMNQTLTRVIAALENGDWLPTTHALMRLEERKILIGDVLNGTPHGAIVEDYPTDQRGPSVLLLLKDSAGLPVHAQWGIGKGVDFVSLVTVYRPDPFDWLEDNLTRRSK
jgi:Domain of unknown function (DUF4258)